MKKASEQKKIGRPLRGTTKTIKRSVTMQAHVWKLVENAAKADGTSVSSALEKIVLTSTT